ncbi:MAG TPA: FAD-binding oxidoreductase [Actinomycetota bacterium]|nr:FAD-binding oxidoreductase [Actinomycetota bacterium]
MNAVAQLGEILGPHRVTTDPVDLARHTHDRAASGLLADRRDEPWDPPLCVARPRNTDQVWSLVRWANQTKTPVVAYGGGSGVCAAVAASGAVVADLRAMDEIVDFDEKSRLVRVQPGMLGPDLEKALRAWGYTLGHEPQSHRISTVGGWIATKAVGQLSARYGGIEDLVRGLEVVLGNGELVRSLTTPRRAAGPELTSLMIGSEGAFGIVTEATLTVSPIVTERVDRCIRFEHMADGVGACRSIAQSDLRPTVVRLYDAEDSAIFLRHHPDEPQGPLLLLSFDGPSASERAAAAAGFGGEPGNDALVTYWWEHRNDAVEEYRLILRGEGILGPHGLADTVEVSGTWSVLRDLYHSMKKALEPLADLVGCHLSHVYPEGACLYFTMASACADEQAALDAHGQWWETAMRTCLDAGGSISHHHGIGRVKAPWLREELGGWHDALVAIKRALDPNGIMNPGVMGL